MIAQYPVLTLSAPATGRGGEQGLDLGGELDANPAQEKHYYC